jgi:hypothetical protein
MRVADMVGLVSIFVSGWYFGQHTNGYSWLDYLIIFGLLAVGFYFSVVLS